MPAKAGFKRVALLSSVCLAALVSGIAYADDGTWQGPGAEWTTGANWSSAPVVPDGTATFTNNGAPTLVTISNNASIDTMQFDPAAPAYSFAVGNGANFTVNGTNNTSSFAPGFTVDTGATLTIGDGAMVDIGRLANGASGGGTIVIGAANPTSFLGINSGTSSTFTGSFAGAGTLELGGAATSLTLTGASNGGNIGAIGGDLILCDCTSGGLTLSGGSLAVNGFAMGIAVLGGTLAVADGARLSTGLDLLVATTMTIAGTGSTVTVDGFTGVGIFDPGPSALTISGGGVLHSRFGAEVDGYITGPGAGTPTVTVTGAGSTWNVEGAFGLTVGGGSTGGPGALTIAAGGAVNVRDGMFIGDPSLGTSLVSVTGAGSTLRVEDGLTIGDPCNCEVGTLSIADGATVTSTGFTGIGAASTLNLGTGGLAGSIVTPAITNDGQIVANFTDTLTLSANIDGAGSLSKAGTGTLTLTGNNSFSGGTTVTGGLINFAAASNFGSGTIGLDGGGLQWATGNTTDISSRLTPLGAGGGTFDTNGNNVTFASAVAGPGSLTKTGPGTLTLTAANTYTGGTIINGGTLAVAADNNLGGAAGGLALDGGTLQTNASFTSNRTVTLNAGGGTFDTNGNDLTLSQGITGVGGLTKAGDGILTLNGASTYTGGTTVNAGTLMLGAGASLASTGALAVNGGIFNLNSNNQTVGALSGTGGSIVLGTGTLTTNSSANTVLASTISGDGGLTKRGTGILTLTGTNTYLGNTTIEGGTIAITADANLGGANANLIMNGGTLATTGSFTSNRFVGLLSGGGTFDIGAGTVTLNGAVEEQLSPGALTKTGVGTLVLAGTSNYTGGTTVSAGILQGTTASLRGTIVNNASVVFDQTTTGTYSGVMSGTGSLTKSGTGRVILTGANTYTGGTTVSAGTLEGTTTSLQGNITNNALVVFDQAGAGTYAGTMSGSGGLTKRGAGTVALTGTNSYLGNTTIEGGAIAVSADANLGAANASLMMDGGTLITTGSFTSNRFVGLLSGGGTFDIGAGTVTFNGAVEETLSAGALTKTGAGTLVLAGTSNYSGGTTVSAGILQGTTASLRGTIVNNASVVFDQSTTGTYSGVMSGTGSLTKSGTGRVILTGANTYGGGTTVAAGTLEGTTTSLQGNITNNAAIVFDQAGNGTYSGVMSGTGSLTKSGAGRVILTGANSYSGGTTVTAGSLEGTTSSLQGNILNNAAVVFDQAGSGTYAGNMSGTGSLTKAGAGTVILSGTNTYSGGTTVSAGILQGNESSLQGNILNNAAVVFDNAGVGTYSGNMSGTGSLTVQGFVTILAGTNSYSGGTTVAAGAILQGTTSSLQGNIVNNGQGVIFTQATNGTYAGNMSGTGLLRKTDGGTLILSGNNSYSGGTEVLGGTLQGTTLSLQGNILNDASVVFNQNTIGLYTGNMSGSGSLTKIGSDTLILTGSNSYSGGTTVSAGTLQGNTTSLQGNILNNASVTFDQATGSTGTYAGVMSGSGALNKMGDGTLILSGTNSYAGGTMVAAGTLQGTTSSLQGNITNDAALVFDQAGNGTYAGVVSGIGSLTKSGTGTVILTGANTYSGGTTVAAGTLQGSTTSLQGNITNNASVVFDQTTNGTYAGIMSGTGSLTKTGAGILTLGGANSYSGGTTVAAGTLQGTTTSLQGNIANNAAVVFDQATDGTYTGIVSGTGSLTKSGTGMVTLTGANTYGGGTTVAGGMLQLGASGGAAGSIVGTVAVDASGILNIVNANNAGITTITNRGETHFREFTTAATIAIDNRIGGLVHFENGASAAGASIDNNGTLNFFNTSTGGNATITSTGILLFEDNTTAGSAVITNTGSLRFDDAASAGGSTITNTGTLSFRSDGTASTATLITNSGGLTEFRNAATGAQATVVTNAGGTFNIALLTTDGTEAGSIAGAGTYELGGKSFKVGGNNQSTTVSGAITGAGGSLVKLGTGTLILSGANTYSGGTTVLAGILQGTTTSLQGNITNNASVVFNQSTTGTYAGNMSGTGGLLVNGSGTVILSGTNSYSGGTTVSGGILQGNTASLQGNILNNASVVFNQAGSGIYAGVMSGSGSLTKTGAGALILSGNNTYSGGTTVSAGVLQGTASSIQGNILNNASVIIAGSGTYAGNMSGTGSLAVGGGTLILGGINSYSGGTAITPGGTLQGSSTGIQGNIINNGAVVFNQTGTGTYAGVMSGSGSMTLQGGGVLNVTGTNTYSGTTTVNASTLVMNGSIANSTVTLNNGGVLAGTGSIGTLVANNSTFAPGNSIGTLNINGNLVQNGGVYQVEVNAAGQSDRMNVTGSATINGAAVQVLAQPGTYARNTTYTILTATGGVSGAYSGVSSNFAFLTPSLVYTSNSVLLSLLMNEAGFASGAQTGNQFGVANALNQANNSATGDFNTVLNAISALSTQQGPLALNAISGQQYADFGTTNIQGAALFMNALGQQMALARGSAGSGQRQALAQACDIESCDAASPFSVWGSVLGGLGSVLGNANSSTLTYNFGGAAAGVDYRLNPSFLLGIGAGYTTGTQWVNSYQGRGWTDNANVAAYASFTQAGFYADLLAGYAYSSNQMQRQISIPGLQPRTANGSTGANQFLGQVELGYKVPVFAPTSLTVTPFARLQLGSVTQSGFSESGANSLSLNVRQQTTNSLRSTLGAELASTLGLGNTRTLDLAFRLGWMHEYDYTGRPITASFAGAPSNSFTVYGATPARDSAVVGFSASTAIAEATSLYLRYDGVLGGGTDNHTLNVGVRLAW